MGNSYLILPLKEGRLGSYIKLVLNDYLEHFKIQFETTIEEISKGMYQINIVFHHSVVDDLKCGFLLQEHVMSPPWTNVPKQYFGTKLFTAPISPFDILFSTQVTAPFVHWVETIKATLEKREVIPFEKLGPIGITIEHLNDGLLAEFSDLLEGIDNVPDGYTVERTVQHLPAKWDNEGDSFGVNVNIYDGDNKIIANYYSTIPVIEVDDFTLGFYKDKINEVKKYLRNKLYGTFVDIEESQPVTFDPNKPRTYREQVDLVKEVLDRLILLQKTMTEEE